MREAQCIRVGVGFMGNAASLLLFTAPILTFVRVIKKRSTDEFSCVPYLAAVLNCLLYTWYGLPIVSHDWENFPVVTINGLGIILEFSFIFIYLRFAPAKRKKLTSLLTMAVLAIFLMTALVSTFVLHERRHRKVFVGSVGLAASIAMYGSPLVAMRQVIQTKSVRFMPFYLSLFSCLASSLWMAYGLLGHDLFIAAPNFMGSPLGILQLVLYCMYRSGKVAGEEANKADLEKNVEIGSVNPRCQWVNTNNE